MAFSLDSKVKDILKNPAAAAVLDKFCEGASKNPQMKLVGGLTLRKLASFPPSVRMSTPFTYPAPAEQRNAVSAPISYGWPHRPAGISSS